MKAGPACILSALLSLGLLLGSSTLSLAGPACPNASNPAPLDVPHLRHALRHGLEGIVVALGSSSTQGAMASDPTHSYPAVLERALSSALPAARVTVLNRGIGGQDAAEELARIDSDVLAAYPQLVIWQVGANGALHDNDLSLFRARVIAGVRRLQAADIDVVLMDNQQSPRLLAMADEPSFDLSLAQVARETGASLFSRRALMQGWNTEGVTLADFIASDQLHLNDLGYYCVAQSVAQAILAGLAAEHPHRGRPVG